MSYSKRHYRLVSPREDTPADVADRIRRYAAFAQARKETTEKYPIVTEANFGEAFTFQENRIAELLAAT